MQELAGYGFQGSIGGPKILLNSKQTWITKLEEEYLRSSSQLRIGESKTGSTVFFEGGFSALKKVAFGKFDAYETGSDDMGTAISIIENTVPSDCAQSGRAVYNK